MYNYCYIYNSIYIIYTMSMLCIIYTDRDRKINVKTPTLIFYFYSE